MICIDHSTLTLFGREIELYGLIALAGAVVITLTNSWLAYRRGLDASFSFRVSALSMFSAAAFHVFFQGLLPGDALLLYYAAGFAGLPGIFWLCARLFGHDSKIFSQLGILSVMAYSVVTRLCCMFAGCCYGPPWQGFGSVVYGPATHNPLPGVALFPLQPVMALAFLGLLIAGIGGFLKKRPNILLLPLAATNLAVYYAGLAISPATHGDKTGLIAAVILFVFAALGLFIYYTCNHKKGV